ETLSRDESISAEGAGPAMLLRADKAIYRAGATARVDVLSSKQKGAAYLDVVKQGQTLLTRTVELSGGKGRLELPLSPELSGTLELHAFIVPADGTIVRDSKVIYVEPADDLKVEVSADRSVYKPGQAATLSFQV